MNGYYDLDSMVVYGGDCLYVVCSSCGEPVLDDGREPARMTMAQLDRACRLHWRVHHPGTVS